MELHTLGRVSDGRGAQFTTILARDLLHVHRTSTRKGGLRLKSIHIPKKIQERRQDKRNVWDKRCCYSSSVISIPHHMVWD